MMIRKTIFLCKNSIALVIVVIGLTVVFYHANQVPKFTFNQDCFEIKGWHSQKIFYNEILSVDTVSSIPIIENKVHGFDTWETKEGQFNLRDVGEANLFIKVHTKLFVLLKNNNREIFYLNTKNRESTLNLFNNLKKYLRE